MEQHQEVTIEEQEEKTREYHLKSLIGDILFCALMILCVILIPKHVVQRTVVDGTSMENTLKNGDNLIVEKISYHFDALDRFDVVVFYPYGRDVEEYYIKRIIGLPGETIQIIGDDIYIDGNLMEENYGKDEMTYAGIAELPYELADDEYFVLGDNRSISKDSRYYDVGPVHKEDIGGKAVWRIWPLSEFGGID